MTNIEKYRNAFVTGLGITEEETEGLVFEGVPQWDSVGHMALINSIEDEFDIVIDTEDIVDFSSFEKGIEILKKYDIAIG